MHSCVVHVRVKVLVHYLVLTHHDFLVELAPSAAFLTKAWKRKFSGLELLEGFLDVADVMVKHGRTSLRTV